MLLFSSFASQGRVSTRSDDCDSTKLAAEAEPGKESFVIAISALRVLTRKTSSDAKEEKRSKSARFKNAKEAKVLALRNRLRK